MIGQDRSRWFKWIVLPGPAADPDREHNAPKWERILLDAGFCPRCGSELEHEDVRGCLCGYIHPTEDLT